MYKIAILKGDGIGPEIMDSAIRVLDVVKNKFNIEVEYVESLIGGAAYDVHEHPLPQETLDVIDQADAVLLGAVGGDKWDDVAAELRPERGLLQLRKHLGTYCNIRPIIGFDALKSMSPLTAMKETIDMCFVRELTGGIYFGEKGYVEENNITSAYDILKYSQPEIERIASKAFEIASIRRKKVTSIDKSNVLHSSKLWRKTVEEKNKYYDVDLNHMYVDNAAMQMIINPQQFDVVLTSNMFGDILSDEASVLVGSIGVLPSASIGDGIGLYEPIHGSAPDIAGQDLANPTGMILSLGIMFKYSFDRSDVYDYLYEAVNATFNQGYGTKDLSAMDRLVTTSEWTERLIVNMS
jgi:3-isopropylmalate dehydrogenase